IEPLVYPSVDAQPVAARGGSHELPEPFRAGVGDGARVEAALDHRREREIRRQALAPEDLLDHREVAPGPAHPRLDDLAPAAGEEVEEVADVVVLRHRIIAELGSAPRHGVEARRAEFRDYSVTQND